MAYKHHRDLTKLTDGEAIGLETEFKFDSGEILVIKSKWIGCAMGGPGFHWTLKTLDDEKIAKGEDFLAVLDQAIDQARAHTNGARKK